MIEKECMICEKELGKYKCSSCGRIVGENCFDKKKRKCFECD